MSIYGSNYEFVARKSQLGLPRVLFAQPVVYNDSTNCSCTSQLPCLRPATFRIPNYVVIKGLLVGCLPSESFLASTLECFFDFDCINLIQKHHLSNDVSYISDYRYFHLEIL